MRIVAGATSSIPRIHAATSVCTARRGTVTSTPYSAATANATIASKPKPISSTSGSTGVTSASGPTRRRGSSPSSSRSTLVA